MALSAIAPLNYLQTAGPAADPVTRLCWGLTFVSLAVMTVIGGLLLAAIFRRRSETPRAGGPPTTDMGSQLAQGGARAGLMWIYIGVGISTCVLLACAVWTLFALEAVAAPKTATPLTIEIKGYQYWWRIRYLDANHNVLFATANELHVPVGVPIRFEVEGGDVIHSFWVPQLGGRVDAIPGQTNITWFQADHPGRYRGQCGEYCGLQHARMSLFVDAEPEQEFAQWMAHERTDVAIATVAQPTDKESGTTLFVDKCGGCHTVRGTAAHGSAGPDLSHLMNRKTIAAGALRNDARNLREWLTRTQEVKPGAEMPSVPMTAKEVDMIVSYLQKLK